MAPTQAVTGKSRSPENAESAEKPEGAAPAEGGRQGAGETVVPLTRRERKKERTRRGIYDAAMRLFTEKGFAEVTIAEICEAADVGRGTFFLHFATKAALLYEFNSRVAEAFRAELVEPRRPAREELSALVERMSQQLQSQGEVMRAMVGEFFNSPVALSELPLEADALPELVTEIIEQGQARGEFNPSIDPRLAAASFFGTAAAILSGLAFGDRVLSPDEVNRQFLQITFAGLAPEPPGS